MIKTQILKGFRDFLPKKSIKRQKIINKLKNVFEIFGFDPLETPALEYGETLMGKYGQEADKLLYLFKDRGERLVGLRYDQTVPLARVVAMYPQLAKPFKRYQIQPVWRAENPQKGRFREFLQCDIDIVGEKNILADFEIIDCVLTAFKALGFKKTKILLNDRKNFLGIDNRLIASIDKLEKIGQEKVIEEIIKKGLKKDAAKKLIEDLQKKPKTSDLETISKLLKEKGYQEGVDFVYKPTLARGLDYYTGLIFEVIDDDYQAGSLGGGGRYDNLIGLFTGQDQPAVGFAFGFDRIIEALENLKILEDRSTKVEVLITIFLPELINQSISIANILRQNNIRVDLYPNDQTKLDKQLKYADKKGIQYAIIIGPDEAKNNQVKLKNLKTREQKITKVEDIIKEIKK